MDNQDKLDLLKTLLLTDEREYANTISHKIELLEQTIQNREKLEVKINPIIQDELRAFTKDIPQQLGPVITKTLKIQIKESKNEVVEALYPILGQMIKKYISHEIKLLSENIEDKTKEVLSFDWFKRKIKSVFTGVSENQIILSELAAAKIDQVFVIDSDSGLLLGSFQESSTMDEDLISGMLTAIKAFVEDAFSKGDQKLVSIEYDLYEIHMYNTPNYYIATAVSGTITEKLENEIEDLAMHTSDTLNKNELKNDKEKLEQMLETIYSTHNNPS